MTSFSQDASVALTGLLGGLLPALAIAASAWLLMKFTPRMNAATRHVIWWLVLALVVLLPIGFTLHDIERARVPVQYAAADFVAPPDPAPVTDTEESTMGPPRMVVEVPVLPPSGPRAPFRVRQGRWSAWLLTIWIGLFAGQVCRLAASYFRLRGIKKRALGASPELLRSFQVWLATCAIRRKVRLLVSDEVSTPLAAGFLHPAVILPARLLGEFDKTEMDHVLLHELSHLARRDDWTNLLGQFASAALWFHPAAIWALRRIEREREMACDEWVVLATGAPRPYAASLARLFELCLAKRREAMAAGMAGHGSHLGERIETLIRRKGKLARGVSFLRVAACALVLMMFAGAVATTPRWIALAQETPKAPPAPPAPPSPVSVGAPRPPRTPAPPQTTDPKSFLAAVVAAGYGDLSVDEIINLRNNGVSSSYLMAISRAGWGKLKTGEIVNLHNNGVSTEFLRALGDAAIPGLTIQGVIDLNNNGINAAYVESVQSAGMGAFPKERIIELHNNGVQPKLLTALRDAGFTRLDAREIIDAQNNGLNVDDLREARHYGSNLTLKQVLKMKQAGVLQHE